MGIFITPTRDPVFGSEQGGYRPVLVIQNNIEIKYSPTGIVSGSNY